MVGVVSCAVGGRRSQGGPRSEQGLLSPRSPAPLEWDKLHPCLLLFVAEVAASFRELRDAVNQVGADSKCVAGSSEGVAGSAECTAHYSAVAAALR